MKFKILLFLILMGGWQSTLAQYVPAVSGSVTASQSSAGTGPCTTANACVSASLSGGVQGSVALNVSGTFSATLQFEVSADGTHWSTVSVLPPNSTTSVTSTTGAGTWSGGVAGMVFFRVRCSTYSSGTAVIVIQPSDKVSTSTLTAASGGGVSSFTGDGTILSNSASTGAVTATLATAAADTVLGNPTGSAATPVYTANPVVNSVATNGPHAGYYQIGPGTSDSAPPSLVTGNFQLVASPSITAWQYLVPPTAATGILYGTNSAGVVTGSWATAAQILALCTGCAPLASPTFTGTLTTPLVATTTNCSAVGTAASPSVVSCSAAPSGAFSCATNASTATCVIDTTAVTANSNIFIQPNAADGTRLSVTCNTSSDTGLTASRLASLSAATSFTINLGTFSTHPLCFDYWIVD